MSAVQSFGTSGSRTVTLDALKQEVAAIKSKAAEHDRELEHLRESRLGIQQWWEQLQRQLRK